MSTDGRSRSGTADTFRYPKKNHQKPWAGAEPLQASLPTGGVLPLLQTEVPCTTWHDVARRRFKCVARPSGDQDVPRSEPRPMERMPEIHQPLGLLLGLFCTSNSQRRFRNFRPRFGKSKSHDAIKGHSIEQPTRTKQQFVRFALSSS